MGKIITTILVLIIIGLLVFVFRGQVGAVNSLVKSITDTLPSSSSNAPQSNCTFQVNSYANSQLAQQPYGTNMSVADKKIFYYDPSSPNITGIQPWVASVVPHYLDCSIGPTYAYICSDIAQVQADINNKTTNLSSSNRNIIAIGYLVTFSTSAPTSISYKPVICDYKGNLLSH